MHMEMVSTIKRDHFFRDWHKINRGLDDFGSRLDILKSGCDYFFSGPDHFVVA